MQNVTKDNQKQTKISKEKFPHFTFELNWIEAWSSLKIHSCWKSRPDGKSVVDSMLIIHKMKMFGKRIELKTLKLL